MRAPNGLITEMEAHHLNALATMALRWEDWLDVPTTNSHPSIVLSWDEEWRRYRVLFEGTSIGWIVKDHKDYDETGPDTWTSYLGQVGESKGVRVGYHEARRKDALWEVIDRAWEYGRKLLARMETGRGHDLGWY